MRDHNTKGYLLAIDIDGVICKGSCWSPEDALKAEPIQENIDLLKQLIHAGHHIVLYSARKEWWRGETELWLLKNKVPYHALIMNKFPADFYYDDRNIDLNNLKKLINA